MARFGFHIRYIARRQFHGPACQWPSKKPHIAVEDVKKLENHWRELVLKAEGNSTLRKKKYVLSMFPYPSGNLHMGHVRVYTISDCLARFYALLGYEVIHPMGWDAFGLPAENAAIERKQSPENWTFANIEVMRQQLLQLGCKFDWDKEITTCHPSYYRWTQLIFVKLYEAGLAYQRESYVNWDPVDKTVLAEEQIDSEGRSWRSGAIVEKRPLRQWFVRASRFTKDLLDGLEKLNHWDDIVDIQKNWLGECDVYKFWLPLQKSDGTRLKEDIDILLKDPSHLAKAAFLAIRPTHILNQKQYSAGASADDEKVLSLFAINRLINKRLPVIVSNKAAFEDELITVHVGLPDNPVDRELLKRLNLNLEAVEGPACGAGDVIAHAKANEYGGYVTSRKLGDWVVSRQRYWGTPIPMIHCQKCGTMPVPENQLPVTLPKEFPSSGSANVEGRSPLAAATDWLHVKCPKCGGQAERETDTLDTFFDSSWYYLRYLDPKNSSRPFDPKNAEKWMPVDIYIGGKEHACLHLYYARVICHFLHSLGWTATKEPFYQLLPQGMVMGKAYQIESTGQYIPPERVKSEGNRLLDSQSGQTVAEKWEKMSKSKHNGVNPTDILNAYGIDMTRLLVTGVAGPRSHRNWDLTPLKGMQRWLDRIWRLVNVYIEQRSLVSNFANDDHFIKSSDFIELERDLREKYNITGRRVAYYTGDAFLLNSAITSLLTFTTALNRCTPDQIRCSIQFERSLHSLLIMLYIFAPHLASEAWSAMASTPVLSKSNPWKKSEPVWKQDWPQLDVDAAFDLEIYFSGEQRGKITIDGRTLKKLNAVQAFEMIKDSEVMQEASKVFQQFIPKSIEHVENYGARLHIQVHKKKKAQKMP